MQIVVTAAEMAALDRACQEQLGLPALLLMENAGRGTADIARTMLGAPAGKRVLIVCGPGNNGGDGFVIARHLANAGAVITLWAVTARARISGDALVNLTILEKMGGAVTFLENLPAAPCPPPHLIIDAMLGTGASTPLRGLLAEMTGLLNTLAVPILAVDLPTGVAADTGAVSGEAIQARATAVMARLKRGLLLSPGREHAGALHLVDIGMPPDWAPPAGPPVRRLEAADIAARLPHRAITAHKNSLGSVGIIAGSLGYTGAAVLAASAALRAGCGLCYLAAATSLLPLLAPKLTEVITWPFADEIPGVLSEAAWPEWSGAITARTALAVGPGLGQHPRTAALVHRLLREMHQPLVLDADGLTLCAGDLALLQHYPGTLILTPHPGEFSRLTGIPVRDLLADPLAAAGAWARQLGHILVLKGNPTLIAAPEGALYLNHTGNPGMATAGSGDVLTGLIAGLLAQGFAPLDAALCGVWLHGAAGDLAAEHKGEMGMIAGDLLETLPLAIQALQTPC